MKKLNKPYTTLFLVCSVDGEALHTVKELSKLRVLTLSKCEQLENSYLHLEYDVQPDTIVT